jgi:hypothetical protein
VECELPEAQPEEFPQELDTGVDNTVEDHWNKCSELGGCTVYTTGNFPEDSE